MSNSSRRDFSCGNELYLKVKVKPDSNNIILEANGAISEYIADFCAGKTSLSSLFLLTDISNFFQKVREVGRNARFGMKMRCRDGMSMITRNKVKLDTDSLDEKIVEMEIIPMGQYEENIEDKVVETKTDLSKGRYKMTDLLIPPLEIKCKCTEAMCLFMCRLCFNKDSQLCLGVGSYALAFYALWAGTPVAVKAFQRYKKGTNSKKREKRVLESFRRELSVLKSLRHPNVIGLYGYQEEGLYLVMEVARNGCLADKIRLNRQREFSNVVWPIHLKIALELVSGLKFLHGRGFIHGDLKSFNVLLDSHYTVKIADFGTSGTQDDKPKNSPLSIAWASPKRLKGGDICMKSDIYAVGVILWELATLKLPFDTFSGSPQKLASKILHLNLRPEIVGYLEDLLSGYRIPTIYVWLMQKVWQTEEHERPALGEIYTVLLNVKASWKCANCGWFNMKHDALCQGCGFDPFSASELSRAIKQNAPVQGFIDSEEQSKDLDDILLLPKMSKNINKGTGPTPTSTQVEELTEDQSPTDRKEEDSRNGIIDTQDFIADMDFSQIVNSESGMTDIFKEKFNEKLDDAVPRANLISTVESDARSITFRDEVGEALTVEHTLPKIKGGMYPKNATDDPDKGIMRMQKSTKPTSKVYDKSFNKANTKSNKNKLTRDMENAPIFVSKPKKTECCQGICAKPQLKSARDLRIYASLDKQTDVDYTENKDSTIADLTSKNTMLNQSVNDTITLVKEQNMQTRYDYSKYPRSCIVKDCGKCTFKTNCVLNVHKNLHNMDTRSGKSLLSDSQESFTIGIERGGESDANLIYRSQGLSKEELETAYSYQASESDWYCDLCNAQNKPEDSECCQCLAMRI